MSEDKETTYIESDVLKEYAVLRKSAVSIQGEIDELTADLSIELGDVNKRSAAIESDIKKTLTRDKNQVQDGVSLVWEAGKNSFDNEAACEAAGVSYVHVVQNTKPSPPPKTAWAAVVRSAKLSPKFMADFNTPKPSSLKITIVD